jgi:hypothetical protein
MLYINSNAYESRNLVNWVAPARQNYDTWPYHNSANLLGNYTPSWAITTGYSNLAYTPNLQVRLKSFSLTTSLLSFTI